jgi:hypothetical protein
LSLKRLHFNILFDYCDSNKLLSFKNNIYDDERTKCFNTILINDNFYEILKIKHFKDNMSFYHDIDQKILNLQFLINDVIFYLDLKIISEFNNWNGTFIYEFLKLDFLYSLSDLHL